MTLTAATLRQDKKCGRSGIAEYKRCLKGAAEAPAADSKSSSSARTRNLLTAAGVATSAALLGVLAKDVFTSGVPSSKVPPKEPPEGLYDSFQPGDLIYQTNKFAGANRAHYAVYVGKRNGEHQVFDASLKQVGGETASRMQIRSIQDATDTGTSYALATRVDKDGRRPSTEELNKIVERLNNKSFDWTGFESNCETLARSVANDLPVSTQTKNVSGLSKQIVKAIVSVAAPKGYRKRAVKQRHVNSLVSSVMSKQDSHNEPDAVAAPMSLTPSTVRPRFDQKCGGSGIPDNAQCTKGAGQTGYIGNPDARPLSSRQLRRVERGLISHEMSTGQPLNLSREQQGALISTRGTVARKNFKETLKKASSSDIKAAVKRGKGSKDPYLRTARKLGKRELGRRRTQGIRRVLGVAGTLLAVANTVGGRRDGVYAQGFSVNPADLGV